MTATIAPEVRELRDYQAQAVDTVLRKRDAGVLAQLIVAATGLGKTEIALGLARRLHLDARATGSSRVPRVLFLAHRDELVQQPARRAPLVWPECPRVGIVKAEMDEPGADLVIASVQTVASLRRLQSLPAWTDPAGAPTDADEWGALFDEYGPAPFDLVIIDEAHHATADTYRRIVDYLGAGKPGGPLLVGVTATPNRGDKAGLDRVFSEIVVNLDILWGIRHGWLCDVVGRRVHIDGLDMSTVRVNRGDYSEGDTGRALEAADGPRQIAEAIAQFAVHPDGRRRRTLAFLPTVATSIETRDHLRALGWGAEHVDGATDSGARRSMLRAFANADHDAQTNCMVLTEGFDDPGIECVAIGRMTKSPGLYAQMVGRGTRNAPGKSDCLVLDVVGVSDEHSLVTLPSLFGIDPKARKYTARAENGEDRLSELAAEYAESEYRAGRMRAEDVELFKTVTRESRLSWHDVPRPDDDRRRWVLPLGPDHRVVIRQADRDDPDSWAAQVQVKVAGEHRRYTVCQGVDLETAQITGEDYARKRGGRSIRLADRASPWRGKPPTPQQIGYARRWRIPEPESFVTAGALSDAITEAQLKADARRGRPRRAR